MAMCIELVEDRIDMLQRRKRPGRKVKHLDVRKGCVTNGSFKNLQEDSFFFGTITKSPLCLWFCMHLRRAWAQQASKAAGRFPW